LLLFVPKNKVTAERKLRFLWEKGDRNGKYRNPEDSCRNMQPRACCYHHFPHLQKPSPTTPPSYTHSTTVKSSPLHLLWYKKLIVVCCLLIVYWSSGSQLTIPLQTASPPCPCMGIVDEFGGQSYRLYRSMVGCWGKDWCHVGTWGTQLDGAIAVRTTLGGENSILSRRCTTQISCWD